MPRRFSRRTSRQSHISRNGVRPAGRPSEFCRRSPAKPRSHVSPEVLDSSQRLTDPLLRPPLLINARRNFGRLDLAAPTPEHVRIENGDIERPQMLINRRLMIEEQSFVRAMRDGHNVNVPEFRAGFAPVAMR